MEMSDWQGMSWLNRPKEAAFAKDGVLTAHSGLSGDFWQSTYYDFRKDDGHAFLAPATGAFTAELTFRGAYRALYDQAGLMIRFAPDAWVKYGIEYSEGRTLLSTVVTNGVSDWSAHPVDIDGPVTVRATRIDAAMLLQYATPGGGWTMSRLCPAPGGDGALSVGPYLCSPKREGFSASFDAFSLGPATITQLHSD